MTIGAPLLAKPPPLPDGAHDDAATVAGLREGKPESFHRFFEAWFPRVWAFACDVASDDSVARRLTEVTLARVIADLSDYEDETSLARFVLARAVWLARDDP